MPGLEANGSEKAFWAKIRAMREERDGYRREVKRMNEDIKAAMVERENALLSDQMGLEPEPELPGRRARGH